MNRERKNKRLAVLLMLLIASIAAIVYFDADDGKVADAALFRIDNPDDIDHVVLASARDTVELRYTAAGWKVNDRYAADGNMIRVLFATVMQNEPKRPVAKSLRDSIATALEATGVKVSMMSGEEVVKTFIAGGNQLKTRAYFMQPETGNVYLMTIPGYRVYVSGVYELDENGFRNKYVFAFNWQNFRGMEVNFPGTPSESFKVSMQKEFFTIEGMPRVDTAKLSEFLTESSLITAETFAGNETIDTLDLPRVEMEIAVFDHASRVYRLRIFNHEKNNMVLGQTGEEFAYFLPEKVRPLMKQRSYFKKR